MRANFYTQLQFSIEFDGIGVTEKFILGSRVTGNMFGRSFTLLLVLDILLEVRHHDTLKFI